MSSSQVVEEKVEGSMVVPPFTFEADHPRNDDLLLQSIPGCRLRSAIDGTKGFIDQKGDYRVPNDQARALSSFPRTPGMRLHVDPLELTYEISDPLSSSEDICERIRRFLSQAGYKSEKIKGVPTVKGTLDKNRMKTLCREVIRMVEAKEGKIVQGPAPKMADVEDLPGEFLLNPGSLVQNTQPMYERDWANWVDNMSRSGG